MNRFMVCLLVVFLAIGCLRGQKEKRAKDVMNKKQLTAAVKDLQSRVDACETRVTALEQRVRAPLTSCPPGWVRDQSSCYGIGTEEVTWAEAQTTCEVYGGYLATVGDSAENTFITKLLADANVDVWLGGTDIIQDGQWIWASTGEVMAFKNFDAGQETENGGGSEDCIVAPGFSNYAWHDYACTSLKYFLCEIKLA